MGSSTRELEGDSFLQAFSFELPSITVQPSAVTSISAHSSNFTGTGTNSRGLGTAQSSVGHFHHSTLDPLELTGEYTFTLGESEGVFDGNYVNTSQLQSASSPTLQANALTLGREHKGRRAKSNKTKGSSRDTPAPSPEIRKKRRLTGEEISLLVNVYQRTLAEVKREQKEKGTVAATQAAPASGTRSLSCTEIAAARTGHLCCVGRNRVLSLVRERREEGGKAPEPQPENRGKKPSPHRVFTDSDIQAIRTYITQRATAGEQTTTPHLLAWLAASRGREVHARRLRYYMPLMGLTWDKENKSLVVGEIKGPPADSYFCKAPTHDG